MAFAHRKDSRGTCPQCKGVTVITNEVVRPAFHHVYKCLRCAAKIGSPTRFSWCTKFGVIAKDVSSKGANDCLYCKVPGELGIDVLKQKCPFFDRALRTDELEEAFARGRTRMSWDKELKREGGSSC